MLSVNQSLRGAIAADLRGGFQLAQKTRPLTSAATLLEMDRGLGFETSAKRAIVRFELTLCGMMGLVTDEGPAKTDFDVSGFFFNLGRQLGRKTVPALQKSKWIWDGLTGTEGVK